MEDNAKKADSTEEVAKTAEQKEVKVEPAK